MATPKFADVKVGDPLPPYVHEKITRTDLAVGGFQHTTQAGGVISVLAGR